MAPKRYWRLIDFVMADGQALELSEITVYNTTTSLAGSFTLTSSIAPVVGSLSSLTDGLHSVSCEFAALTLMNLAITLDAGTGNTLDIKSVVFSSGASKSKFPIHVSLEYSSDGITWFSYNGFNLRWCQNSGQPYTRRLKWPGPFTAQTKTSLSNVADRDQWTIESADQFTTANNTISIVSGNVVYARNTGPYGGVARNVNRLLYSGKYYVECVGVNFRIGVVLPSFFSITTVLGSTNTLASGLLDAGLSFENTALYRVWNSTWSSITPSRPNLTDAVGICIDVDNRQLSMIIGGVQSAVWNVPSWPAGTPVNMVISGISANPFNFNVNLGHNAFVNTPPAGFEPFTFYEAFNYEVIPISYDRIVGKNGYLIAGSSELLSALPSIERIRDHLSKDTFTNGTGFIKSTVSIDTTPASFVRRRVFLREADSGLPVSEAFSQPGTGIFEFKYLDMSKQYVIYSIDTVTGLPSTISGPVYPTKMPGLK